MNKQLNHDEYIHDKVKYPIYIILDNLEDIINIGSIFRLSDALGVKKIFICSNNSDILNNKKINKVSRDTIKYVEYEIINSVEDCIKQLKKENVKVLALEITNQSVSLNMYNFNKNQAYAWVIGNEKKGVSQNSLNNVDDTIKIDMYGNNSSMNVSVATGIAIHHCLNKIK